MNYFGFQYFVALILLFSFDHIIAIAKDIDDFPPFKDAHFQITNLMTGGKVFRSHCFLGKEDYSLQGGYINIKPGQTRAKYFKVKWYSPNTYTCIISIPKDRVYIKFMAYSLTEDSQLMKTYCGSYLVCKWIVQDDGLYVHNVYFGWLESRQRWSHEDSPSQVLAPIAM
ncbi:hypothetical protein ACFE04_009222 [Oxalis oulophora]